MFPLDTNNAELAARNGAISNIQTIGNVIPGGVHSGILRAGNDDDDDDDTPSSSVLLLVLSLISFVSRCGRSLDKGLKIRDFKENTKKKIKFTAKGIWVCCISNVDNSTSIPVKNPLNKTI
mmetsp:Transcript_55791/g.62361  ORF Transcript_55791/g.62361 Transcript_55791/m.62361 type:complete len:121 (+) Transcript_55791:575-937(+)